MEYAAAITPKIAHAQPGKRMLYTEQHRELMRSVTKFVESRDRPARRGMGRGRHLPAHELFRKMGQQGLLGIHKPEKYGGQGLDYSYEMAFCEAIGTAKSASTAMAIGVQTDMATPALARYGSDELRDEFLKPSIAGEYVACIGVSEVGSGSDVASIKTTAKKDGGDYVINGGKMWTTNGTQADWMCLLANTGDGPVHRNKSLICLPMKTKGVEVARKLDKLGMRASDTAQIHLRQRARAAALSASAKRAWASPTRCGSSRRSGCGRRAPA